MPALWMTASKSPSLLIWSATDFVSAMLERSPTTICSAPRTVWWISSARAALRACRTTSWPCSIKSSAAILPRPSAEPVTKTRAIRSLSYGPADIGFKNGLFQTVMAAIARSAVRAGLRWMPDPPHHGSGRRPHGPSEARQRHERHRHGDRQKEAILLQIGNGDEDDDGSRDDVHQWQRPDGRQCQKEYDGSDETAGHGVRKRPPRSTQILDRPKSRLNSFSETLEPFKIERA